MAQSATESRRPEAVNRWTGFLLYWVLVQAKDAYTEAMADMHLSLKQIAILQFLEAEGSTSQARLSERLGLDKGAVSVVVTNLQEQGLVQRTRQPRDGRSLLVDLLDKGREQLSIVEERNAAVSRSFFECLANSELQMLHQLLGKVADAQANLRGRGATGSASPK